MNLTFLAVSVAAMDDLEWLHKAATCEMGLSSACGLMLDRLREGTTGVIYSSEAQGCAEEGRLEAMELYRNVRELLQKVASRHERILNLLHQPQRWDDDLVKAFGVAAPLAAVTKTAREACAKELGEKLPTYATVSWWLSQVILRIKKDDRLLVRAIACEARRVREEAYGAFEIARELVTYAQPGGRAKRYPSATRRACLKQRQIEETMAAMEAETNAHVAA